MFCPFYKHLIANGLIDLASGWLDCCSLQPNAKFVIFKWRVHNTSAGHAHMFYGVRYDAGVVCEHISSGNNNNNEYTGRM